MSVSGIVARAVAVIGSVAILLRHGRDGSLEPAFGSAPKIPPARPQGVPTLKMPTARGWAGGKAPTPAAGLKVNAFAAGLKHPRWIEILPNGDVLAAEALSVPGGIRTAFDYAIFSTMKRAAAVGASPNRITLLRDADGDGVAEVREVFLDGLNQPFGMALIGDTFYVGNTDGLVAFPYVPGATRIRAGGRKLLDFPSGGHWTRSLLVSPDKRKIYIGVGSLTNIGDNGPALEEGRAAIHEFDVESGKSRIFAGGLRNPVGMAWEPTTTRLWTVVNERDGLGDETPPDYLTSVGDGGFYGWPYSYWDRIVDHRVAQDAGPRRKRHHAGLRARRPHRLARPLLASRRHAARLSRGHGDRAARFLEPQPARRLQGHLRALRGRTPGRAGARHPHRLSVRGRAVVLGATGRRRHRAGRLAAGGRRCRRRDLAGDWREGLSEEHAGVAAGRLLPVLTGRRCRQADEGGSAHTSSAPHPNPSP